MEQPLNHFSFTITKQGPPPEYNTYMCITPESVPVLHPFVEIEALQGEVRQISDGRTLYKLNLTAEKQHIFKEALIKAIYPTLDN
ncbi:hypothetical protein GCM10027291_06120 [Telluribacter humicola]